MQRKSAYLSDYLHVDFLHSYLQLQNAAKSVDETKVECQMQKMPIPSEKNGVSTAILLCRNLQKKAFFIC